MNLLTLSLNGFRYYWRSHLGVLLGVLVGSGVLAGALVVGDSVRGTLRDFALLRLGRIDSAIQTGSRLFTAALADRLREDLKIPVTALLNLEGTVTFPNKQGRANRVQVHGVGDDFWAFAPDPWDQGPDEGTVWINQRLADRLLAGVGEEILIRVEKPSILSRDAPLSTVDDMVVALRGKVGRILGEEEYGRFSLSANQIEPYNAFLNRDWLAREVEHSGRANMLLAGMPEEGEAPPVEVLNASLRKAWTLPDASLELREIPAQGVFELRTDRIFIDDPLTKSALEADPSGEMVLSYFVNRVQHGDRVVPYSIAAGLEPSPANAPRSPAVAPHEMSEDQITLNDWTAEDLGAAVGDRVQLAYYVAGPMRTLEEATRTFTVRAVVPIEGIAADPELMPEFPGLHDSENCRDWTPGVPIKLEKIRDKDEEYWDAYRGTPKAFVTLHAAEEMWRNRFGTVTAVRYPSAQTSLEELSEKIRARIDPASVGLFFLPIRDQALAASSQALDFGPLFLGFSFFLIVASLLLVGLLFVFGMDQRSREAGILLAVGYRPAQVRKLFMREGLLLALLGSAGGTALGLFYGKAVLWGLATLWQGAVGAETSIRFHWEPLTLLTGFLGGVVISWLAIRLSLRKHFRTPARELLAGENKGVSPVLWGTRRWTFLTVCGIGGIVSGLVLMSLAGGSGHETAAGLFFGSGTILLLSCWALSYSLLGWLEHRGRTRRPSFSGLGISNATRRRGRSLAAIMLLACGSFLVIAVGANRRDASVDADRRSSGTGGFALFGRTTLPVFNDLDSEEGLNRFGMDREDLEGVGVVQARLRAGDEASCLNLNRAQTPNLLGIDPQQMIDRGAFSFAAVWKEDPEADPWSLLEAEVAPGEPVPAIVDYATMMWALGKKPGDTLSYVDEAGKIFQVRLVAGLSNSILQGFVIVSEKHFVAKYPSTGGYQVFLIDAPLDHREQVAEVLEEGLLDFGLETMSTITRLAEFNRVENTYLSIFQTLGGLGLLLGSIGLGVVVLRNVLERRAELATLRALGFRKRDLGRLIFTEHWWLLLLGLLAGSVSGLVAALPAVLAQGSGAPYLSLSLTLLALFASGVAWIWIATKAALRGSLLGSLRQE
jgi:ABC-type antimicrobial peptide transport system permease subunit